MNDRTVHASCRGFDIVRYDRAGKWYLEPKTVVLDRQQLPIRLAVHFALWGVDMDAGEIFLGRKGGGTFDRLVTR